MGDGDVGRPSQKGQDVYGKLRGKLTARTPIFVAGPTCSGKTAFAHFLSDALSDLTGKRTPILSMDSMQIYRGMDIGTAKPSPEELSKYRYAGIDIVEPSDHFSTGDYCRYASEIYRNDASPFLIVCGGTGLYYDALTRGLSVLPPRDAGLRSVLKGRQASEGLGSLYAELLDKDPVYARKIMPGDSQRIVRALEVVGLTGKPFSSFHGNDAAMLIPPLSSDTVTFGLNVPREILHDRIAKRIDVMLNNGFEEEAERLYNSIGTGDYPASRGIGYSHFFRYFRKELTRDDAVCLMKRDTRRYAKRQMTWFRRDASIRWCTPGESTEDIILFIEKKAKGFIGSGDDTK